MTAVNNDNLVEPLHSAYVGLIYSFHSGDKSLLDSSFILLGISFNIEVVSPYHALKIVPGFSTYLFFTFSSNLDTQVVYKSQLLK